MYCTVSEKIKKKNNKKKTRGEMEPVNQILPNNIHTLNRCSPRGISGQPDFIR